MTNAASSPPARMEATTAAVFQSPQSSPKKRIFTRRIIVIALLLAGLCLVRKAGVYLRVISIVVRFSDPQSHALAARFASYPVSEEIGVAQTEWGPIKYRRYTPLNVSHLGGIVLVHGVHREGIDEPRLINFSRALARAGVEVMTPQLSDLADYRVTPHTADFVGWSAEFLGKRMNRPKVGVVGLSFSGGLALIAAAKPRFAPKIGFVLALGAHDDLSRVARFLATNTIELPDGSTRLAEAHEYGALVVAYSHVEDFFSETDAANAQLALGLWLSERPDEAGSAIRRLTPEGKKRFDQLLHHREWLKESLLHSIQLHEREMAAASPAGQLAKLTVPVYLLHAAHDDVIPASETLWLSREIPQKQLRAGLISTAIIHADIEQEASLWEKWKLVHFLAQVLAEIDGLGS